MILRTRMNSCCLFATVLLLVPHVPAGAQTDAARLLVERAAAKELRGENIAKQFKNARYRLAGRAWDEAGGWKADRSRSDSEIIAKDLKIPLAADDISVVECERPRTAKACGIVGDASIVTMSSPVFLGDSARVEISFWFWTPPADRINDRFPDQPGAFIHYLIVKGKGGSWRVDRVLRRSIG